MDEFNAYEALGQEEGIVFTREQIEKIHDMGIEKYGGSFGVRDENLLESVVSNPYQSVFGEDLYPTPFDKAAKYLLDFARYQVFIDGNKRTGLLACTSFLKANNIGLTLSSLDVYNLTMSIANNQIEECSDISKILKENSVLEFGKTQIDINKDEEKSNDEPEETEEIDEEEDYGL